MFRFRHEAAAILHIRALRGDARAATLEPCPVNATFRNHWFRVITFTQSTPRSALAAHQHGVVSSSQLQALGFTDRAVRKRCAAGRLHRIHRGVYAVGHSRLTIQGRWMAAVLFGGPGTVLSHRAAGAEGMLRRWSGAPAITVPSRRRRSGLIEIHCSSLPADERTVLNGIPITTWPRTLLDLATVLDHDALLRALNEADARELTDPISLVALLERHRGERGAGALRRALDDAGRGSGITREELEERFAAFAATAGSRCRSSTPRSRPATAITSPTRSGPKRG